MMYTITQAFVQAITEFLPISSSGHLLMTKHVFGLENPGLILDMTLHLATTVCVGVYLWRHRQELFSDRAAVLKLTGYALVATAATGVVGLALEPYVRAFYDLGWLAFNYFIMAILLFACRWLHRQESADRGLSRLNMRFAIAIGVIQGIAVFPGISRSGLTIIGMMLLGFDAVFAFYFSFLIAVPTIIAASGYEFLRAFQTGIEIDVAQYAVGFSIAAVLGYPILIFLKSCVQKGIFYVFGLYCLALSGVLYWVSNNGTYLSH